MAAYETPEQAANFLAGIHLDILNTGKGDFSPNHVKYTCQLTPRYGDPFTTDYQSNPSVHGEPTVTQVVSSLLSDSRIRDAYRDVDDFADDMGYRKPSEAIRAWEGCRKAQDWVRDTLNLSNGEANQLSDTLDEYETEVQAQVEQLQEEQARQDAYEHPPVDQMLYGGQKFITIKEAIDNLLDLGDYGEDAVDYVNGASYIDDALQEAADGMVDIYYHDLLHWLPDNYEWLEEADAQGLLEGCKGDLMKMTQAAQYECYSQNLYDHKADILAAVTLAHLKDQGVYAISEDMADTLIEGIREGDHERFPHRSPRRRGRGTLRRHGGHAAGFRLRQAEPVHDERRSRPAGEQRRVRSGIPERMARPARRTPRSRGRFPHPCGRGKPRLLHPARTKPRQ